VITEIAQRRGLAAMVYEAVAPAPAAHRRAAPNPVARVVAATALLLVCVAMVAVVGSGTGAPTQVREKEREGGREG